MAAQRPESPGVLVLSRCAGAAESLPEAVIVNPYIPAEVADGIARALAMPLEERIGRHEALLASVLRGTAGAWSRRFVEDLEGGSRDAAPTIAPPPIATPARRRRTELPTTIRGV